jgi:hypothetical protein
VLVPRNVLVIRMSYQCWLRRAWVSKYRNG